MYVYVYNIIYEINRSVVEITSKSEIALESQIYGQSTAN